MTKQCKNCNHEMAETDKFCANCGQKFFDGRIKIKELLSNMMINIIHMDSKFIKMCWHLFIPGKVSTEYFEGKIIRYPNPLQYFFIIMFFFVLLASKTCNDALKVSLKTTENPEAVTDSTETYQAGDFFKAAERFVEYKKIENAYHGLPQNLQTPSANLAIDSVLKIRRKPINRFFDSDSLQFNLVDTSIYVAVMDMVQMSPDHLPEYYGISPWYEQVLVKQGIKSMRDLRGVNSAMIGNITWSLLTFIAIMSVLLWLFLRKRRPFYVEHFIFLMHYMSALLLTFTVIWAIKHFTGTMPDAVMALLGIGTIVFFFFALKRFYRLKKRWAGLYTFLFLLLSLLIGCFVMVLGPLLTFLLL